MDFICSSSVCGEGEEGSGIGASARTVFPAWSIPRMRMETSFREQYSLYAPVMRPNWGRGGQRGHGFPVM